MFASRGATTGSSPLARGLPRAGEVVEAEPRIIPARAGFTTGVAPYAVRIGDHPRSRGVYSGRAGSWTAKAGSSPLARGLRDDVGRGGRERRIIPARAGFTLLNERNPMIVADHPRSRGVYPLPLRCSCSGAGSSPLARGLHLVQRVGRAVSRIIPARAGFTCPLSPSTSTRTDHPRSRGVYDMWNRFADGWSGSSPLARGLLHRHRFRE